MIAYVCGVIGGRKQLREHIEYEWKVRRNKLITNGINNPRRWARYGQDVISQIDETHYGTEKSDLTLVCLSREA